MNKFLFVLGAPKTASTTMMGMLNCHPDILILHELTRKTFEKRRKEYIDRYPSIEHILESCTDFDLQKQIGEQISLEGYSYKYFGTKHVSQKIDFGEYKNYSIIYMTRDIRTWLAKSSIGSVFKFQKDSKGMKLVIIDFIISFIQSFLCPHSIRVSMEQMVSDNKQVICQLEKFLGFDMQEHLDKWWDKVGKWSNNDPKNIEEWWTHHQSSLVKPTRCDVSAKILDNEIWDHVLPIFDKYYNNLNGTFGPKEIQKDIQKLKNPLPVVRFLHMYKNINEDSVRIYKP